jgi:hypothetical protein
VYGVTSQKTSVTIVTASSTTIRNMLPNGEVERSVFLKLLYVKMSKFPVTLQFHLIPAKAVGAYSQVKLTVMCLPASVEHAAGLPVPSMTSQCSVWTRFRYCVSSLSFSLSTAVTLAVRRLNSAMLCGVGGRVGCLVTSQIMIFDHLK